ncbi:MAG: copper homeostasis protein [Armatimonadota bacterium]|jgi:copper homeostasis protein
MVKVEVVVDSVDDALAAADAGVSRVEVGCAPELGGLTPTPGVVAGITEALTGTRIAIAVLIRPRAGGFCYTREDIDAMCLDIRLIAQGVDSVVFGALTEEGMLDLPAVKALVNAANTFGLQTVFHRAIDVCANPEDALAQLENLGVNRILTSGCGKTCLDGSTNLARWIEQYKRLTFVPAGGIRASNVAELHNVLDTEYVHAGPRCVQNGPATARGNVDYGTHTMLDSDALKSLVNVCREL